MPKDPVYSDEVYRQALATTMGNKSAAAKMIGCRRQAIYEWLKRNPSGVDFATELKSRGESIATGNIAEAMVCDDRADRLRASIFYLRSQCGWSYHYNDDRGDPDLARQIREGLERHEKANGKDKLQ